MTQQIDLEELTALLREGAGLAFRDVQEAHPDEQFYAFVLFQKNQEWFGLSSSTESGFRARTAKWQDKFSPKDLLAEARWSPNEWEHEQHGSEHLSPAGHYLERMQRVKMELDDDAFDSWWNQFKGRLYAAMVLALADLDAQGTFAPAKQRGPVALYCVQYDGSDCYRIAYHSSRLLNPPDLFATLRDEYLPYIYDEDGDSLLDRHGAYDWIPIFQELIRTSGRFPG